MLRQNIFKFIVQDSIIRYYPKTRQIGLAKIKDSKNYMNLFMYEGLTKQMMYLINEEQPVTYFPPERMVDYDEGHKNYWAHGPKPITWRPHVNLTGVNIFNDTYNPIEILKDNKVFLDEDQEFYPNIYIHKEDNLGKCLKLFNIDELNYI